MPGSRLPFTAPALIVNVWVAPTAFVAVDGAMLTKASTHVFAALPEPPAFALIVVLVVRRIDCPPTLTVVEAWICTEPGLSEVIVTVQLGVVFEYWHVLPPTKLVSPVSLSSVAVAV